MTFSQALLFITVIGLIMCALDAILGMVCKDWKRLPWEEDEIESNRRAAGKR